MTKDIIPSGWIKVRLGNLLDYEQPYKYEVVSEEYKESGIPVLTAGKSFILGYSDEETGIYDKGNVIIFDDFTTDSKYVTFPFKVKSSAMKFLTLKNENENSLLLIYNYLQLFKLREVKEHKRQWLGEFSKYTFYLPSTKKEQEKIASILLKINTAIEQTQSLINKYSNIKKGLMHDLLTYGIDEKGQIRSEATHKFKDSILGRIPDEWNVIELEKVTKSITDGDHMAPPKSELGVPFITITNLTSENTIDFSDTMFVPKKYYDSLDLKRKPQTNDVIYSVVGSIGIPVLVTDNKPFVFQRHIAILRPNSKILPRFLFLCMTSSYVFYQADFAAVGIAQKTISLSSLRKMKIKICDEKEQERILMGLNPIDQLIVKERKTLLNLQSQKQGLISDLLTGKVRVKGD